MISFADRVNEQADIVRIVRGYVPLKKSGQNFVGLCPFHSEAKPSFAVNPVKQIYHCFGCGVGGDVFSFVMAMDKLSFPEAVRVVAEKSGIAVPFPCDLWAEKRDKLRQLKRVERKLRHLRWRLSEIRELHEKYLSS